MSMWADIVSEAIDREPGYWCEECKEDTASLVTYTLARDNEMTVGRFVGCPECGGTYER